MKKIFSFILLLLITIIFFTGCGKNYSNYKSEEGYVEYISDNDTGYEDVPYYNCDEAMESSEEARKYYENNKRRCGSYIITDYEDGVCINRYVGFGLNEGSILEIPDELDGKPVIKIGGYLADENDVIGAFAGNTNFILKLPATVKIISNRVFLFYSGIIDDREDFTFVSSVEVNTDNPYYASYEGALYTKDKKALLHEPKLEWISANTSYTVPDFVEIFEPSNGVCTELGNIVIGKNVNKINTFIDKGEDGIEPNPYVTPNVVIKGYKNTVAEDWAIEQYAIFEELK